MASIEQGSMTTPAASDPFPVPEPEATDLQEIPMEIAAAPNASAGTVENAYGAGDSLAGDSLADGVPHDLKQRTARGAVVSMLGQVATFVLRMGSMVVLARLLTPNDFGLVGMVTACTGFLGLFRDAGLSMATIQRVSISRAQTSTLFWINVVVGVILATLCAVIAPILTRFYNEPRLFWVTIVVGGGFLFNGATAQHRAMLQRNMRFAVLTVVDMVALVLSIVLSIAMAVAGLGYWALVGMTVALPAASLFGVLVASGWIPGRPERGTGVRSMLRYGGTVTLNSLIIYVAYNADKVLLGRFWGAATLGIYGRAYQLVSMPNDSLSGTIALVAFPALARLQNDPSRLKSYFLKGYGLFLSLVMPITMGCALFAEDIIRVFLGPKWGEAIPVFRLLAPTILTFALINPFGWFLLATGGTMRSLRISFMVAPVVILGYVAGLHNGPTGVATGFSVATVLLILPVIFWATRGTSITVYDAFKAAIRPFASIVVGAGAVLACSSLIQLVVPPLLRLVVGNTILFGIYFLMLWFVMGQKSVYLMLLKEIGIWPFGKRRAKQSSPI
jgi:O-antigen/teichoic acid export membrane protein